MLPKFRCAAFPTCKTEFLDTQITGAVFMLQRTFGEISLPQAPPEESLCAAERLKALITHGGIVTDTIGLGKIFLALLYLNYAAVYQLRAVYKPSLILSSNGVVLNQWQQAIRKNFPDLTIVLTHGERPQEAIMANNWVSAFAMRQAPANLQWWPKNLRYIFDQNNPLAS